MPKGDNSSGQRDVASGSVFCEVCLLGELHKRRCQNCILGIRKPPSITWERLVRLVFLLPLMSKRLYISGRPVE